MNLLFQDGRHFLASDGRPDILARIEWTPDGPGLHVYADDRPMPRQRLYDSESEILKAFEALGYDVLTSPPGGRPKGGTPPRTDEERR